MSNRMPNFFREKYQISGQNLSKMLGSRAFRHTKFATVHFAIGLFATGFFATGFFATCHWDFSPQSKKIVANNPI